MAAMQPEESQEQFNENEAHNEEEKPLHEPVIVNIYFGAARELVSALIDPTDKEICSLWLDFLIFNINEEPVVFDYLKLFLLSLNQSERMPPFDDLPPPIDEIQNTNIDVITMGRKMIENYRAYLEEKKHVHPSQAGEKEREDKNCKKDSVPQIDFGCSPESKEYFATQKIPLFGRQCFYAVSPNELPLWWPVEPGVGQPEDYLSRIAWFMYWEENKRMSRLDECSHKKSLTSRTWWKDAIDFKRKQDKDLALGFRWHSMSLLPHTRAKLDKKLIEKFFKNVENKGMEVYAMDENAEGIKDKPIPDNEKLTISKTLQDLLDKRRHGTVESRKGYPEILKEQLKEDAYNKDWYTTFEDEDEAQKAASESTENFLRKVQENSIKRLLQTSPEYINVKDEAQIRQLKELYRDGRTGEQPPPPSPDDTSAPDLLRRGLSWSIPAFKRTYADGQLTNPRSSFHDNFGADANIFHSTMQETVPRTCQPCEDAIPSQLDYVNPTEARYSTCRQVQRTSRQPSPCRSREASPFGQSGRRFSLENRLSTSGNNQAGPSHFGESFPQGGEFAPRECPRQLQDDRYSPGELGTGRRPECSPTGMKSPLNYSQDALDLSNAEELDFTEQFLLPTADIEFDEDIQNTADTFFTCYDDADADWTAPEEIIPDATYDISLPPIAKCSPTDEQFDRREGRLFIPAQKTDYESDDMGTIEWPETEHLYDMNVEFDEDEPPFEYLERSSPCGEEFPECGSYDEDDEFQGMRWQNLRHVADQLGDWHFKS